jgi:uncharacterized protein with HEPN domain
LAKLCRFEQDAEDTRLSRTLEHITEAIEKIFGYVNGLEWSDFSASRLIQDATIRNLEIIGEAARDILRADPAFSVRHPALPLGCAIGMRNALVRLFRG